MPVTFTQPKLGSKLLWMAVAYLAVALTAIGFTLYESWKLEGGAAVINDMGSQRMRSYRIAYLLAESRRDPASDAQVRMNEEIARFEVMFEGLRSGDPARPLVLPRDREILDGLAAVEDRWVQAVRPLIGAAMAGGSAEMAALRAGIEQFAGHIDRLVGLVEANNAHNIALLRYMQFGLIALALAGTVTLIYLMFLLVVRPVTNLSEGMQRMTAGDFDVRLPVETHDEFGDLAEGFNRMAGRLQELYATLEQRVAEKTRDLALRNRELGALYEVAQLLNAPSPIDDLCRDFLRRLMRMQEASGGSVRLIDAQTRQLHLFAHEGLTPAFAGDERCIDLGECLCGVAAQAGCSAVDQLEEYPAAVAEDCRKAGYRTVAIFPVRAKGALLGVFNLYFTTRHVIGPQDRQLFEALGQHLGVAIENQRLASRDRELAVYEERSLLARELHDSIAQSLAFLNIQTQMLEDSLARGARREVDEVLGQIRAGVRESYDDVRELLTHFRARVQQEEDIGVALRRMLTRFEAQTGLTAVFADSGTGVPLSAESQLQVLHILQEALSNVRKHAGATAVRLVVQRDTSYRFTVSDDGRGFDVAAYPQDSDAHIGLRIMRERAARIGGEVEVVSQPGGGTAVTLSLPLGQAIPEQGERLEARA